MDLRIYVRQDLKRKLFELKRNVVIRDKEVKVEKEEDRPHKIIDPSYQMKSKSTRFKRVENLQNVGQKRKTFLKVVEVDLLEIKGSFKKIEQPFGQESVMRDIRPNPCGGHPRC